MGLLSTATPFESDDSTPSAAPATTPKATQGTKNMSTPTPLTGTKVVTGVIRGSYCHIFRPAPQKPEDAGKDPKYQITLLIPKEDTATLSKMRAAQQAATNLKWPNKKPAIIADTIHDGDGVKPNSGEPFGDECKGHYVMAVSSKFKPKILDREGNEVIDPSEAGSGDYFKASINFYGYDTNGKKGVSAGLNNLLLWDKGESLGGISRAEDDFASDIAK